MTQQEIVERDIRMALGELQVQLIISRAQVQELQERLAMLEQTLFTQTEDHRPPAHTNGAAEPPATEM